jgi:tetratricopeptide (TPR) repeat protein
MPPPEWSSSRRGPLAFSPDDSELAAATYDHTILLWNLRLIRQQLRAMGLDWDPALGPPPPVREPVTSIRIDDSEGEADALEREGRWADAVAPWSRVIESQPDRPDPLIRRGTAYAELGRWSEAAADYAKAVERQPGDVAVWQDLALAHLAAGHPQDYRRTCTDMLERFARTIDVERTVELLAACKAAPDAVSDRLQLVTLAEKARAAHPGQFMYLGNLGQALYRAGRFDDAVARLEELLKGPLNGADVIDDWLFLAMAHQRLGHIDAARAWLAKASRGIDELDQMNGKPAASAGARLPWEYRLTVKLLRGEAEAQISGNR